MKAALIISTYNWPEALELVLKSVANQTIIPAEILIADDGSGVETQNLINNWKSKSSLKIKHIWQEDEGFRKSMVLNKAIASARSNYIIQIDGDCILHSNFIEDHLEMVRKNTYLYGSRVNIKQEAVSQIFSNKIYRFSFFASEIKNRTRNLRIPILRDSYKVQDEFSKKTRGCNISFWKEDFIAVNGYDENMEGWGREDSELILRMLNNGVKGRRLRYGGIVYHIHHSVSSKEYLEQNDKIQKRTIEERKTWSKNGIDQYLSVMP